MLFIVSRYNFLLFHGIAELFSIAVAWAVFILVWNARRYINNDALLLLGSAYLFIGFVDLLHTLAFKDMGFFPDEWGTNLPTQLWVAGRYMEGLALLLFSLLLGRRIPPLIGLAFWAGLTALLLGMIFFWCVFPDCHLESIGLTPFKVWSEYVICLVLAAAFGILYRKRAMLDEKVYRLMAGSMAVSVAAELTFTTYLGVFDISNIIGHFLKIISYMFIYLALIRSGLTKPFDLLFRELEREKAVLRETQRHLSLIVDTVPALIWQKDHNGTYLQANKTFCKTLGISQEHILGKTDHDIFPRKIADKFREIDLEVLRTGTEQMGMEEQYASISGVHGWRLTDRMIFRNQNNSPAGIIGFAKDITQHKTAVLKAGEQQEQLLQAAKMTALGTLVAGVAHEVNNPNNFIMLNAPLLEKSWQDAVPVLEAHQERHPEFTLAGIPFSQMRGYVAELFSGIHEGSKRIKRIVSELKNFARQAPPDMNQEVQLNQVIEAALVMLRKTITQHTNQFTVSLAPNLPLIRGDFQKLEQVVVNLLINACQALPHKDHCIALETFPCNKGSQIAMRVTDNGCGIPPDIVGRICDPFFSTKQDHGGVGLGLTISMAVVQDHGGQMLFDSAPDLGTTVTVYLNVPA
ncbi:hypothetical protein JCM31598_09420 [Desulfonatronum parangueonense]